MGGNKVQTLPAYDFQREPQGNDLVLIQQGVFLGRLPLQISIR